MSKTLSVAFLIAICAFLFLVQADREADRQLCDRLNRRCERNNAVVGTRDEVTDASNDQCRLIRGPQWRDLTRCQILRAHCELSLVQCDQLSCLKMENLIFPRRT